MEIDSGLRKRTTSKNSVEVDHFAPGQVANRDDGYRSRKSHEKASQTPIENQVDSIIINEQIKSLREVADILRHNVNLELDSLHAQVARVEYSLNPVRKPSVSKASVERQAKEKSTSVKIFRIRESRLSDLLTLPDMRTLYNVFASFLLVMLLSVFTNNFFESGEPLRLTVLYSSFGKLPDVAVCWVCMFTYALLSYGWMYLAKTSGIAITYLYLGVQVGFMAVFGAVSLWISFPPASGFIVMCETTRFAMKIHSFYRECRKGYHEGAARIEGSFSHYVYFLFAPTLLYRDEYPRSSNSIKWGTAFKKISEVLFVILYVYVIFERYCVPQFSHIRDEPNDMKTLLISTFNSMIPGTMCLVFGFFGLLHCWLNAWAELLCFGDRQFYRDWWNSKSFGEYYPKWNGVVHDFLYNYVYLDTLSFLERRKVDPAWARTIAKLFVVEFSAGVHEYIIACAIGFFYPVLWILFGGPGVIFMQMNASRSSHQAHNVFFWSMLIIGSGVLMTLYCREYYARHDFEGNELLDIFHLPFWKHFFSVYSWDKFKLRSSASL